MKHRYRARPGGLSGRPVALQRDVVGRIDSTVARTRAARAGLWCSAIWWVFDPFVASFDEQRRAARKVMLSIGASRWAAACGSAGQTSKMWQVL